MSAGWVAASVRARSMARRRLGQSAARRLGAAPSLESARELLVGTAYADVVTAPPGLAAAQHAVADVVLWEIRVLAGWLPAAGTTLARTAAAAFERENLVGHLVRLDGGRPGPAHDLGSLSTAWTRVRRTTSVEAALAEIAASPWGRVTSTDPGAVRDELTAAWLARVSRVAPAARAWARAAAVLLVARVQAVESRSLPDQAAARLTGLLGRDWASARTLEALRETLTPPARTVLDSVRSTDRLWVAEAALWTTLAVGGERLLRRPLAGPDHVVGALAVLGADAFLVDAALAAAATGTGERLEGVLGGVA